MKASVIHNFIDNKIRMSYNHKNSLQDVIDMLNGKITDPKRNENCFNSYVSVFSQKRKNDILFLITKESFDVKKMVNLLKLRDKIIGFNDFDIVKK